MSTISPGDTPINSGERDDGMSAQSIKLGFSSSENPVECLATESVPLCNPRDAGSRSEGILKAKAALRWALSLMGCCGQRRGILVVFHYHTE